MKASGGRLDSFVDSTSGIPFGVSPLVVVDLYRADPLVLSNDKAQAPGSLVVANIEIRLFIVTERALIDFPL